jgi:hypothetical protein
MREWKTVSKTVNEFTLLVQRLERLTGMTFRELAHGYLTENGMFDSQADDVIALMVADPANEPMMQRWTDHVEGYPDAMKSVIIVDARRKAVEWIDANCPLAWYRPMFAPVEAEAR